MCSNMTFHQVGTLTIEQRPGTNIKAGMLLDWSNIYIYYISNAMEPFVAPLHSLDNRDAT